MNFEQLCRRGTNFIVICKIAAQSLHRVHTPELRKRTYKFLRCQYYWHLYRKKKLRLGRLVFETKETRYGGVLLWSELEIRYLGRDNLDEEERKIENIIKRQGWQTDAKNVCALIVVIFMFIFQFAAFIYNWYRNELPTLAFRSERLDTLLRRGLTSMTVSQLTAFSKFIDFNNVIMQTLAEFCILFDIIF